MYRQSPFSTFKDHDDYVRTIDYAKNIGRLFSASDDGKLFIWDLSAEKLIQKYETYDETNSIRGGPSANPQPHRSPFAYMEEP